MFRLIRALSGGAVLIALGACGSTSTSEAVAPSTSPSASVQPSPPATTPAAGPSLLLADSRYGKILTDGAGRTLYLFAADRGADSTCYNACATSWPPLLASTSPVAGPGLARSLLSISVRSDSGRQVAFNGHPLYTYIGDGAPGEIRCQAVVEFGGGWFVVDAQGNQISTP